MDALIHLQDVGYSYNGKAVLTVAQMEILRASITGLAGPNGSGKTTLLKLLSGVTRPTTGSVTFHASKSPSQENRIRRRFCLLPQETYLLRRTVYENIAYGLRVRGRKKGLAKDVDEALKHVGLPRSFARRQWHELSGGEAQRVALAARLALKPDCLLMDEPTASVDIESARCIRRAVLHARKEWGTALIIASHNRDWLNDICDRIVYLYNGRILDSSFENLLTGPWEPVDNVLVACRLSGDQKVQALKPANGGQSAVISPAALRINSANQEDGSGSFQGVIVSVAFERHLENPQVHIACGEQRFVVSVTESLMAADMYRPGQKVTVSYNPEDVVWLD